MSSCLFCRLIGGEIPARKVYEDADVLAFHDLHPQAPVHVLVIPTRHIPAFDALRAADGETLGVMAQAVNRVAADLGLADSGFRVVCNNGRDAGQSVDHLHWHVLGGRSLAWPPG